MSTERWPIAVKKSPRSHHAFLTYIIAIVNCLSGNPLFTNPSPTVALLKSLADAFGVANAKARGGGTAAVADRNAKRRELEEQLDHLVDYVRGALRALGLDAAAATAAILSAGLSIRLNSTVSKPPLAVKYGRVSGEVLISALAVAHHAIYLWEYSLDQKSWTNLPQTMTARTSLAGLTPGQRYAFRFRAQTRKGLGDYSDVVTLMVI